MLLDTNQPCQPVSAHLEPTPLPTSKLITLVGHAQSSQKVFGPLATALGLKISISFHQAAYILSRCGMLRLTLSFFKKASTNCTGILSTSRKTFVNHCWHLHLQDSSLLGLAWWFAVGNRVDLRLYQYEVAIAGNHTVNLGNAYGFPHPSHAGFLIG